jgi:hypothetical protein
MAPPDRRSGGAAAIRRSEAAAAVAAVNKKKRAKPQSGKSKPCKAAPVAETTILLDSSSESDEDEVSPTLTEPEIEERGKSESANIFGIKNRSTVDISQMHRAAESPAVAIGGRSSGGVLPNVSTLVTSKSEYRDMNSTMTTPPSLYKCGEKMIFLPGGEGGVSPDRKIRGGIDPSLCEPRHVQGGQVYLERRYDGLRKGDQ